MKNIKEVIDEILAIIASMKEIENLSGDEISEKIVKLAVLKINIGQALAKLDYQCNMAEAMRKQEWNRVFSEFRSGTEFSLPNDKGLSIAESEVRANMAVDNLLKEEIEEKRKLTLLKNLRQDCESVIMTCQSRLGQLKSEMVEAKS